MDSMINYKNTTPPLGARGLMVASILLLAAFQVFWLRKEYNEQKNILQKETDILFQNTIQALEDSIIQQKILKSSAVSFKWDNKPSSKVHKVQISASSKIPNLPISQKDTTVYQRIRHFTQTAKIDTINQSKATFTISNVLTEVNPREVKSIKINSLEGMNITNFKMKDSISSDNTAIFIIKSDTMKQAISRVGRILLYNKLKELKFFRDSAQHSPVSSKIDFKISFKNTSKGKKKVNSDNLSSPKDNQVFIRLDHDSLKINDIQRAYEEKIQQAKIHLPFQIVRQPLNQKPDSSSKQALITAPVTTTMPFGSAYAAIFPSYQGYLFKKIIPQSLFSFFLLAITGLAFGAIYRNLQQQRRLTELKNDFISNVTHELKTPIATVSVAIEALQSFGAAQNPQLTREYLDISKNELNRLTLLVDKVLKMATFEQQGLNLNLETVDLAEVAQQVIGSMKLQFEKYHAQVSFEAIGHHFTLNADRIHLTNVVYNLLDNALKYSGEVAPEIKLTLNATESEIGLSIADKGIGIAPEYQDKVFDKFFRVPTGDTHNVKGYGLGLNYVASVVKQHSGQISVQSEVGQGSTFRITLPKTL